MILFLSSFDWCLRSDQRFLSEAASSLMCPVAPPVRPFSETGKPDLKTIFQIGLHCPKQRRRGAAFVV